MFLIHRSNYKTKVLQKMPCAARLSVAAYSKYVYKHLLSNFSLIFALLISDHAFVKIVSQLKWISTLFLK